MSPAATLHFCHARVRWALLSAAAAVLLSTSCRAGPDHDAGVPQATPPGADEAPGAVDSPAPTEAWHTTPPPHAETGAVPEAGRFLPPLEDYTTDDDVETGEMKSSLDHGGIPYHEVRRRLILDPQGFALGEVTVVTFEDLPGAAGRYLDHRFGNARRTPVEVAGVGMLSIAAEPFQVLAWAGPGFVVTFQRGQEVDDAWLEGVARATVTASVPRS